MTSRENLYGGLSAMNTGLTTLNVQLTAKQAAKNHESAIVLLCQLVEEQRQTNEHLVFLIRQIRGENP